MANWLKSGGTWLKSRHPGGKSIKIEKKERPWGAHMEAGGKNTQHHAAWDPLWLNNFTIHGPSRHKWWLAYLILWGPELAIKLPFPLPFLFLQAGIRDATAFTCGSVRVSVQLHHYQFNSPEWRIMNYITFTFSFSCFFRGFQRGFLWGGGGESQ